MPVTLAQAALNTQDDLDRNVIDEFRKSSAILDALVFHDAVNPMGGGSTLTYGYHRVVTQRAAAFRAINSEYTPEEAEKQRFTVDLKPLGGSFQIDRVLAGIARGTEVSFQMQQLITATSTKFIDEVINGDTAVDANGFDGLDKALTGSDTEIVAGPDWTDLDTSGFQKALDRIDEFLMLLNGAPSAIIGNRYSIAKLAAIGRRANQYQERPVEGLVGAMGAPIVRRFYGGNTMLIDAGEKAGSSQLIVPIYDTDTNSWTLTIDAGADGGTYSLRVDVNGDVEETSALAFGANAAAIDAALEALSNVAAADVTVTGTNPFTIVFGGTLAGIDVVLSAADQGLTDGGVALPAGAAVAEVATAGGYTDLYAVRIGMDGFHGVAVAGQPLVRTWLPDFERAGAVKTGEAEMGPVAAVLKATKSAAVLRGIRVR